MFGKKTATTRYKDMPLEDAQRAEFWRKGLNPGDIIFLSDITSIIRALAKGEHTHEVTAEVVRVERMYDQQGFAEYHLAVFKPTSPDEAMSGILCKIVTQHGEPIISPRYIQMLAHDVFPAGNRADAVQSGFSWLFRNWNEEVANRHPSDINYGSLFYTKDITFPSSDGRYIDDDDRKNIGNAEQVVYEQLQQGELNCDHFQFPADPRLPKKLLATVSEYQSEATIKDDRLTVIEVGDAECAEGGLITIYIGREIQMHNIHVLDAD